jgi:NAD(P)-dependent dehydrogenase (short-subunit alcohol dehydrogenase family)
MSLSGVTVLVTGAASGIGRATAIAFAKESANLVLVDNNANGLLDLYNVIDPTGARCVVFTGDVRDERTASTSVGMAVERFGELNMAINCAGIEGALPSVCFIKLVGQWVNRKGFERLARS